MEIRERCCAPIAHGAVVVDRRLSWFPCEAEKRQAIVVGVVRRRLSWFLWIRAEGKRLP
jgi:hypothetical protein